jgi:predicted DNA-binding transcriptional regulator YafY
MRTDPVRIEEIPVARPTTRVLTLLELLQANLRLGGTELAERLGVDPRTVRRDVARLQELGIPVVAERGRYGGYRLLPGYKLPPLMLTDDEATAVVLGLLAGRRLGLATSTPGAADSALAKLTRVLPAALRERTEAVQATLDFTLPARPAPAPPARAVRAPATATVLVLAEATRRRRRVHLRYRSFKGRDSERDLDPYGLVFHAGRWYVTGLDHASGEVRTFRLDRILAAEPGTAGFDVPDQFDPVEQVADALARAPWTWDVQVLLAVPIEEARRRLPPGVATLAEAEGGVLLRARAERLDGMARMLAGLGWPFTIVTPDELRAEVLALAGRLSERARAAAVVASPDG